MRFFLVSLIFLTITVTVSAPSIACPAKDDLAISIANPQAELRNCKKYSDFQLALSRLAVNVSVSGYPFADTDILHTIQNSLETSAHTLTEIGPYATDSIKVFLVSAEAVEIGVASSDNIATAIVSAAEPSSCLILVWSPIAETDLLKFALAHEFFHCVQYHEFENQITKAESDIGREDPGWWMEGTAEWFATMTYANKDFSQEYADDFHANFTGSTKSILNMSYENVVFFRWIQLTFGSPRVFSFVTKYYADENDAGPSNFNGSLTHEEFNQFRNHVKNNSIQRAKP